MINPNMKSMWPLMHALNGLIQIKSAYTKTQQVPETLKTPPQFQAIFTQAKEVKMNEKITLKYNIVKLIRWMVDDISELQASIFQLDPSEFNVALTLIKMMEMNQLIKATSAQEVNLLGGVGEIFENMLEDSTHHCEAFSKRIKNKVCNLISENCQKSRDTLLLKLNQIIANPPLLVSNFLQLELNCAFGNILLNLRRLIRIVNLERRERCIPYLRALKLLQLKLLYLSIASISKTEGYVRKIYDDIFNSDRKTTYIYLLHDEKGIQKLYKYFQEAPFDQIDRDIVLMKENYQREMQRSTIIMP